ncbi:MAG: hypothetical protein AABZ33_07630 [Chloroflexota bacterium]
MTAPTETEVRVALGVSWVTRYPVGGWPANDWDTAWNSLHGMSDDLYDLEEMRPSEIERLDEIVFDSLRPIREEAQTRALEAIVDAVVRFGHEHPDVPRAVREAVTA